MLFCAAVLPPSVHATNYTLEPDYTQGVIRWNHLGFSSPTAQFAQGHGTLQFDAADPKHARVEVTIPVSTLNTGVPGLDEHLRSKDFFEIDRFPDVTFKSVRVEPESKDHFKVTGDLTIHGVSKPVTLQMMLVRIGTNPRSQLPTIGFDGSVMLKRSDFGLGKFVPQVSDDIEIRLISQAVEAEAYAKYLKEQEEAEKKK
jgi:polyisoprenoid-binding protein YceI